MGHIICHFKKCGSPTSCRIQEKREKNQHWVRVKKSKKNEQIKNHLENITERSDFFNRRYELCLQCFEA